MLPGRPPTRAREHATRSSAASRRSCAASAATTSTSSSNAGRPFNLAKLIVGSEGTLGVVLEAKLSWFRCRRRRPCSSIQFADLLERSGDAADPGHGPSAVEVMDSFILDNTQAEPRARRAAHELHRRRPGALLCVEFYADRADELPPRLDALEADCAARGFGYRYHHALDLAAQARIWSLREAALGLSMAEKDDAKAISFVEDTAVAPEQLRDYIERFLGSSPARHDGRRLRPRLGRLPARPAGRQPEDRRGRPHVRGDRRGGRRPGARVRRRALGRARRRPGAQPVHGEDVRPGALPGVPRDQAHVRPARHPQPRQDRRRAAADRQPALRRRLRHADVRRRSSTTRRTAAWAAPSRCAAASAPAARSTTARCARRTWRRATRSTRRAAGPTRCGWR